MDKLGRLNLAWSAAGARCSLSGEGIPSRALLRRILRLLGCLQTVLGVGLAEGSIRLLSPGAAHHGNVCSCPVLILRGGPVSQGCGPAWSLVWVTVRGEIVATRIGVIVDWRDVAGMVTMGPAIAMLGRARRGDFSHAGSLTVA